MYIYIYIYIYVSVILVLFDVFFRISNETEVAVGFNMA